MSVAITDLLIELADPKRAADFLKDPTRFLDAHELTDAERDAVLSRDLRKLRLLARSIDSDDPNQQFNRFNNPAIVVELDLVHDPAEVELDHSDPGREAVDGRGALYVDANGVYYRAVRES